MKLRKGRVFASLIVAAALAASSVSCAGNTIGVQMLTGIYYTNL